MIFFSAKDRRDYDQGNVENYVILITYCIHKVSLLLFNHRKLSSELSLQLIACSSMNSIFLDVNIRLFPRWSKELSNFISWLNVFFSSKPSLTDLCRQRVWISLIASGWKIPSEETASGQKLTPSLRSSAPTALSFLSWPNLTGWFASFFQKSLRSWEIHVKSIATGFPALRKGT